MLFELLAFYSLFLGFLFVVTEYSNKPTLGIIASVLIFPLAAWIFGSGVQIQVGEQTLTYQDLTSNTEDNETTTTGLLNATTTYSYSSIPVAPYIELPNLMGLVLCLLGLYGMFHYAQVMLDKI
jgi:hypothetical protein